METSLKTGFAQIFSCCPKNLSCPKFGGAAAPLAPPARTPMVTELYFSSQVRTQFKLLTVSCLKYGQHFHSTSVVRNIVALQVEKRSWPYYYLRSLNLSRSKFRQLLKVDTSSTFCNKLSKVSLSLQLANFPCLTTLAIGLFSQVGKYSATIHLDFIAFLSTFVWVFIKQQIKQLQQPHLYPIKR